MVRIDKWEVDDDMFARYITIIQVQYESGKVLSPWSELDTERKALHLQMIYKAIPEPNDDSGDFLFERRDLDRALGKHVDEIARRERWIETGMKAERERDR